MQNLSISLYFSQGSSDKEYHIELKAEGDGYLVNFRYGRRGSTLKPGTKTASPVAYAQAKKIYDDLLAEKVGKGYSPGEDGAPYQDTPLETRFSGLLPQLLNPIEDDELDRYFRDNDFVCQEKFDGKRCLIRKSAVGIEGVQRAGLVIALPQVVADAAAALSPSQFVIDGELVGKVFYAFDLLELQGRDHRETAFITRSRLLQSALTGTTKAIRPILTACGETAKRSLLGCIKAAKGEGIVFKHSQAPYRPGRPSSGGNQLKYKLWSSATCRVVKGNASKRSVAIELRDDTGAWTPVGNVSIPANQSTPKKGNLIEVKYLYAYRGGSLYQPTYLGQRDDITETTPLSQLKYKAEASDEDDAS